MRKQFCVYLMTSRYDGTLYTGVTSNLPARVWQHREHVVEGFTDRYDVERLVWFELHDNAASAITREKRIKKWRRAWKVRLIEETNPEWRDLYDEIASALPRN